MSNGFTITDAPAHDKAVVLRVGGRLDARSAQELLGRCRKALEEGRSHLVVNLGEVSFIASSGIGTLLALTEEFRDAGGALHLVTLPDAVKSVIDLLNLTQFLNLGETEAEVLETLEV